MDMSQTNGARAGRGAPAELADLPVGGKRAFLRLEGRPPCRLSGFCKCPGRLGRSALPVLGKGLRVLLLAGAAANLLHPGTMIRSAGIYVDVLRGTAKHSDLVTGQAERR